MAALVDNTFTVTGSTIEITVTEGIKDASIYTITIDSIKENVADAEAKVFTKAITTALNPFYTTVYAVRSVLGGYPIPDDQVVFHIWTASQMADYIMENLSPIDPADVSFETRQFVTYKAAYDAMLGCGITKSTESEGLAGKIAEIQFEQKEAKGFQTMLDDLKDLMDYWKNAMTGYVANTPPKPKTTVRGKSAVSAGTVDGLIGDTSRSVW